VEGEPSLGGRRKIVYAERYLKRRMWLTSPRQILGRCRATVAATGEAMVAWMQVVKESEAAWSVFTDRHVPPRIYDAVNAIGGIGNVDPADGFQRRDFIEAFEAWQEGTREQR
jgi:hypothetical protein